MEERVGVAVGDRVRVGVGVRVRVRVRVSRVAVWPGLVPRRTAAG